MYYNIENYTPKMDSFFSEYTDYRLGQGWPNYKKMNTEDMANLMDDRSFEPRYDTRDGLSEEKEGEIIIKSDIPKRDIEMMKALYYDMNSILNKYVEQAVEEYEYMSSPIYSEDGIDRETLSQIVNKNVNLAQKDIDEVEEIVLSEELYEIWGKKNMFKNMIEAIVLNEIFAVRRPNYRRVKNNYRYENGVYDGVRPR